MASPLSNYDAASNTHLFRKFFGGFDESHQTRIPSCCNARTEPQPLILTNLADICLLFLSRVSTVRYPKATCVYRHLQHSALNNSAVGILRKPHHPFILHHLLYFILCDLSWVRRYERALSAKYANRSCLLPSSSDDFAGAIKQHQLTCSSNNY